MMQFALVSLIPGLIRHLQDSADPALDHYSETVTRATSLKTSDRSSCRLEHIISDIAMLTAHSTRLRGTSVATVWKSMFDLDSCPFSFAMDY